MTFQPTQSETSHPSASTPASILVPGAAALSACAWFLVHSLAVLFGPEDLVMQWLYDDAFYYMIAGKHFSEQHLSSFDGITRTSGYHPLWMWLCSVIYGIRGRLDLTYVRCCMALTLLIVCTLLAVTIRYALRRHNAGLLWAIALAATSYSALNNGITVMEWPLVLLCWFLLHLTLTKSSDRLRRGTWVAAFACGFAGSFSRTDFGLLPAAYLAAAVLVGMRHRKWQRASLAATAVAGSVLGLPLIFLYNHQMTGDWLQSSAKVKHLAASLSIPFNPVPAFWQFLRVLFYLPPMNIPPQVHASMISGGLRVVAVAIVLALAALALNFGRLKRWTQRAWPRQPLAELSLLAAIFAVTGYLLLDGFNSQATYGWYTGSVTGCIVLLCARLLNRVRPATAAWLVFPLLAANISAALVWGGNARTQMGEVVGGKALRQDHPGAVMAGGDVGKPSFYNNGTMFNLDGLMNNEVVPYLAAGRIQCYLLHRHIAYIYNLGSVTLPIVEAERRKHGEPPIPWNDYLIAGPGGAVPKYYGINLGAIRASGECPADQ